MHIDGFIYNDMIVGADQNLSPYISGRKMFPKILLLNFGDMELISS